MTSETDSSKEFKQALENYHASYNNIDDLIQSNSDNSPETTESNGELTSKELHHLRAVATDQHKLITELQSKLRNSGAQGELVEIVDKLEGELDKQKRFVQESETCIQLMEDELNHANKEIDQLKSRLKSLPSIKAQLQDFRKQKEEYELKVYALTSENRKLIKKIEQDAVTADNGKATRLQQELSDLETRYANLEEKYLNMKIKQ